MSSDVAIDLIKDVNTAFQKNCVKDRNISKLMEKLDAGEATYKDAYSFATSIGNARAKAFKSEITSNRLPDGKMYYNIASRLLENTLGEDYKLVSEYAQSVQGLMNAENGISLKALQADKDKDRIKGFIDRISSEDNYDNIAWILDEPVKVHALSVVDDTVKKNSEFQSRAGVGVKVIRIAEANCCKWCADLDGEYNYPGVPGDVFARHDNCRCIVIYDGHKLSVYESKNGANTFREERNPINEKDRKIHYGTKEKFERGTKTVTAKEIKNYKENNLYIADDVSLSPKEIRWINDNISESKAIMGVSKECDIPIVIVNDKNILASYNPVTNTMFVSSELSSNSAILKKQVGFAAPDNVNSTTVHELFHWKDAEEYRNSGKTIVSAGSKSEYSAYQREKAIKNLTNDGIDISNPTQIKEISDYAFENALVNNFEEVYTEYRTKRYLEG